jgi:methionyl-tRNA formyltransferase
VNITLFSSNQPRHLNLAKQLSDISDNLYFISEVTTVFPGKINDFYKKSEVMERYFTHVIEAEQKIFGDIGFLPSNVKMLSLKSGDLNLVSNTQFSTALNSDVFVVFGASYIKGWLIDFLIEKEALNIHMGISPYYRGSSCNFWALYDNNPSYVGATIHMLSKGLDSGDILFHCVPKFTVGDTGFDFTMRSVAAAHAGLTEGIASTNFLKLPRVPQTKEMEIRYTRNHDFTDQIAKIFLNRNYVMQADNFNYPELINPIFF